MQADSAFPLTERFVLEANGVRTRESTQSCWRRDWRRQGREENAVCREPLRPKMQASCLCVDLDILVERGLRRQTLTRAR